MLRNLTVDHVVPKSRGGADDPDNLQLLCGACNSMKGTKGAGKPFLATMGCSRSSDLTPAHESIEPLSRP